MEQATTGAVTTLIGQLGIAGLGLAVILALGFWWLKASRDLRTEKEGVIERQAKKIADLEAERNKFQQGYYALRFPGAATDPFKDEELDVP